MRSPVTARLHDIPQRPVRRLDATVIILACVVLGAIGGAFCGAAFVILKLMAGGQS